MGRMMALEAARLNIGMKFLDGGGSKCPAAQVVSTDCIVKGSLKDETKIRELADLILEEGLSVRALEKLALNQDVKKKNQINRRNLPTNEYKFVEEELTEILGTKVKVKNNKVEITFTSVNDLNRIIEIIK